MSLDLQYDRYDHKYTSYYAYAYGKNRKGETVFLVLTQNKHLSGCNPNYWTESSNKRPGHGYGSEEAILNEIKYATGYGPEFESIDRDTIKVVAIETHCSKTTKIVDNTTQN